MVVGTKEQILESLICFMQSYPSAQTVAIKINLQSPPAVHSPRTDKYLLEGVISCLLSLGHNIVLVEGADGHLRDNLDSIGLEHYLHHSSVDFMDVDEEKEILWVHRNGRNYPIPRRLQNMDVRLAVPCATKRPGYLFSCNVKTFVGLLPRGLCKNGTDSIYSRPIIHEDLTAAVSDLYRVICETIPFHYYINGGNTISEMSQAVTLPDFYCSINPIELDMHLAKILQAEVPQYLIRLK